MTAGNPADNIMRRVIARKAQWQAGLQTWRAEAYSSQTFRSDGEVVAVIEGQTTAYWDTGRRLPRGRDGTRTDGQPRRAPVRVLHRRRPDDQLLRRRNRVRRLRPHGADQRLARWASTASPSTAARHRDGTWCSTCRSGRRTRSSPASPAAGDPRRRRRVARRSTVRPSDAVQFPLVNAFTLAMEQQFSSFGQSVTASGLAAGRLSDGPLRAKPGNALIRFPRIGFEINSRLTDYAVNVAVPDSLYDRDGGHGRLGRHRRRAGCRRASCRSRSRRSARFAEIDSTRTLAEAFRPTGPLARFFSIRFSADTSTGSRQPPGRLGLVRPDAGLQPGRGRARGRARDAADLRSFGRSVEAGYQTGPETLMGRVSVYARVRRRRSRCRRAARDHPAGGVVLRRARTQQRGRFGRGRGLLRLRSAPGGGIWGYVGSREGLRPSARINASYDDYDPLPSRRATRCSTVTCRPTT